MAQDNYAIKVVDVKKKFKVYHDKGSSLKEKVLFRNRNHYEERWVLNGISFNVKKGEAIGLVGHNGCGKSTTLKLLTRIIYPDQGSIEIKGRVSSLLELGAGFHPDMSGRENIYINASIFGLTKQEIDERIQSIIDFSELEEFLDNPVRTYSSGMYMRLAFSVAINVNADVLLIDEILAVGDVNFQTKCFERLREIKSNGTTIVIVSHGLSDIEKICDRSIWIDKGLIKQDGIPKYVHESYLNEMENIRMEKIQEEYEDSLREAGEVLQEEILEEEITSFDEVVQTEKLSDENEFNEDESQTAETLSEQGNLEEGQLVNVDANEDDCIDEPTNYSIPFKGEHYISLGNKWVEFTEVFLLDENYKRKITFKTGDTILVQMKYKSIKPNLEGNFGISIFRDDGVHCYGTNISIEYDKLLDIKESGEVIIKFENVALLPGKYMFDLAIHSADGVLYDDIRNVSEFYITSNKHDEGICRLHSLWFIDGEKIGEIDGNK